MNKDKNQKTINEELRLSNIVTEKEVLDEETRKILNSPFWKRIRSL